MGRPQANAAPYRDDPDDVDAVSMHTTRKNYEYDDAPALPSYSDSEAEASASRGPVEPAPEVQRSLRWDDPYRRVQPLNGWLNSTNGKVKNTNETSIRMDGRLRDSWLLQEYVTGWLAATPPHQLVRIVGTHAETRYNASSKKNEKENVVDFDITLDLGQNLKKEPLLWSAFAAHDRDQVYRGSFRKTRAKGYREDVETAETETPTLQDWCREFCNDKSTLKVFRVTRHVHGLDTEYLKNAIEKFVRETHYYGHLDVSFPLEEKNIDIYNDHWINRWRTGWQRWIFYLTFLWLITWPMLFFATKYWAVYNVQWFWSYCDQDHEQQRAYKVYAGLSEREWASTNKNLIKSLVLEKYSGDASLFPTDVPEARVERGFQAAMPSTGNQNVDAAVNFIQGGMSAWNTLQGRGGRRDTTGWGGDS